MVPYLLDFERGLTPPSDYDAQLAALQSRLGKIQAAYIVYKKQAIIMLEGWDAAGKGGIIQRLTARWDPRYYRVWPIGAPTHEEKAHHFLWRFWQRLPATQQIAVFDRSWYGRVLVERVEAFATPKQWKRAYDEINDFEAQQVTEGTLLIKLFVHVTQQEQEKRLQERLDHPWKRWKITPEDFRNLSKRSDYNKAIADMLKETSTKVAPWQVVDGNNKKAARLAALTYIADTLEQHVAMEPPPLDPGLATLGKTLLGRSSN